MMVTVTGVFTLESTDAAAGTISFVLTDEVDELDGTHHDKTVTVLELDEGGEFTVDLLATQDPNLSRRVRYAVHEAITVDDEIVENFYEIEVPYGAATANLVDLARVQVNFGYQCAAIA